MKRGDFFKQMMQENGIRGMRLDLLASGEVHLNISIDVAIAAWELLDQEIFQDPKAGLCEPKEEQQKSKEKLDERKADKPIPEKVIAGSKKREKIDMGKLIALAKAGRTREWIADEMGVSVATVYNYLKKAKEEGRL